VRALERSTPAAASANSRQRAEALSVITLHCPNAAALQFVAQPN
jgi:hypothetical protein